MEGNEQGEEKKVEENRGEEKKIEEDKIEDVKAWDELLDDGMEAETLPEAPPKDVTTPEKEAPAKEEIPAPAPTPEPEKAPELPVKGKSAEEMKQEVLAKLAAQYKLSDELAQAMLTEPELVLPKVAAQLHLEVARNVLQSVKNELPQMVQGLQQHQEAEHMAEQIFFKENPDLQDAKFRAGILGMGQVYRQLNPKADSAEASKAIGQMVRTAFGLKAPEKAPPETPFTPARGGGGASSPKASASIWDEFLTEE